MPVEAALQLRALRSVLLRKEGVVLAQEGVRRRVLDGEGALGVHLKESLGHRTGQGDGEGGLGDFARGS